MAVFVLQASQLPRSRPVQSPFCRVTCYMLHLVLHVCIPLPFLSSSSLQSWFVLMSTKKILNGTKIKRNPKTKHCYDSGFLPLFISVQFPNCNILLFFFPSVFFFVFWTLKTQPCTIQSSKSLLLQPQLKIVYPKPHFPFTHLSFSKDGGRPAEVCQMDQQFYKARQ